MKSIDNYLSRIGLPSSEQLKKGPDGIIHEDGKLDFCANRALLARVMEAQSRSIPFENIDIVLNQKISMDEEDVEEKLVNSRRGGYCFELNSLLRCALEEMGFCVMPLLCRVRWSKPDDTAEPNTGFTHLALKVTTTDGSEYLADVGFAGSNSMEPIALKQIGQGVVQKLPEGNFRVVPSKHKEFFVLELMVHGKWQPLYEWRDERAPLVDQIAMNWFSCTFPTARFTTQFFAFRIIGNERHHILNNKYVIRKGHGVGKEETIEVLYEHSRLVELVEEVFGVKLLCKEGIDKFL